MPIHRERYRRREGRADVRGQAWAVICQYGLRALVRKRGFLALMLLAWVPCLIRAVQIYVAANFPQASFLAISPRTFRDFLDQQELFVFFVTVYAGSGLVADDLRANALQIYLSRPVTRAQYAAGKLSVLAVCLALVTWVPAMVLLVLQPMFSGTAAFLRQNLFLVPAITVLAIVEVAVAAFTMVALSSLSRSRWFVAIMYTGLAFFSHALFGATRVATRSTGFSWMSLFGNVAQVGDVIFRLPPRYTTGPLVSALCLAALIAVSAAVLSRRIRAVEVVS